MRYHRSTFRYAVSAFYLFNFQSEENDIDIILRALWCSGVPHSLSDKTGRGFESRAPLFFSHHRVSAFSKLDTQFVTCCSPLYKLATLDPGRRIQ